MDALVKVCHDSQLPVTSSLKYPALNKFFTYSTVALGVVSCYCLRYSSHRFNLSLTSTIAFLFVRCCLGQKNLEIVQPKTQVVSSIFKKHGFSFLKHATTKKNLPSILKTGYLLKSSQHTGIRGTSFKDQVFFDATQFTETPDSIEWHAESYACDKDYVYGDLAKITLIFDLVILDNTVHHVATAGWHYGVFNALDQQDYLCAMDTTKLDAILENRSECGEVVVYKDVSLKNLVSIWVHPHKRDETIDYLKSNRIKSINGIPVEQFVCKISKPTLPIYTYENRSRTKQFSNHPIPEGRTPLRFISGPNN